MSFIAYVNQWGAGCDYTIACGKKLIELNASTHAEALDELKELVRDEYGHDDQRLEYATLYEVKSKTSVDLDRIYSDLDDEAEVREAEKALKRAEDDLHKANQRLQQMKNR